VAGQGPTHRPSHGAAWAKGNQWQPQQQTLGTALGMGTGQARVKRLRDITAFKYIQHSNKEESNKLFPMHTKKWAWMLAKEISEQFS